MVSYNGFNIRVACNHENDKKNVRIERNDEIVDTFEMDGSYKQCVLMAELFIDMGEYRDGQTTLDNIF